MRISTRCTAVLEDLTDSCSFSEFKLNSYHSSDSWFYSGGEDRSLLFDFGDTYYYSRMARTNWYKSRMFIQ